MIPAEFKDENNRLMWEYFFTNPDGKPTPALLEAHRKAKEAGHHNFVAAVLPNAVQYDTWDRDTDSSRVPDEWFRENCQGAWTLWVIPGSGKAAKNGVYFELAKDAMYFKMTFQEGS